MANPKKKLTINPLTGKFDYINTYDSDIDRLESGLEVLFEDDRTPSDNTLAVTKPNTRNYFMPVNLDTDDRYIMVFGGNTLTFLDCRNPYAPEQILNITFNAAPGLFGQPQASVSIGDFIYVCATNGKIHTIDWSDRENPLVVAEATISSGQHYDIASNGVDTLFIANTTNSIFIAIDASDPLNLSLINTSALGGLGAGVAYYNGYAYCTNFNASQVHTFEFSGGTWNDIDQTASATNSTRLAIATNLEGKTSLISNRYNNAAFSVHDLTDPADIGVKQDLITPEGINIYSRSFVVKDILHFTSQLGNVMTYDIRDLSNASLIGTYVPKYTDNTNRFVIGIGGVSFTNRGAVPKELDFMLMVGTNALGVSNPNNRDVVTLELPLIELNDKIRFLSVSKTIEVMEPYYQIINDAIIITLPASPIKGDSFKIANFSTGSATLDGNGNNIMEETSQVIYKDESFDLIYNDTEWKVI